MVEEKLENVLLGCVVYTKIKYKNQEKGKVSLKMCGNVCCEVCNEELSYPLPTVVLPLIQRRLGCDRERSQNYGPQGTQCQCHHGLPLSNRYMLSLLLSLLLLLLLSNDHSNNDSKQESFNVRNQLLLK